MIENWKTNSEDGGGGSLAFRSMCVSLKSTRMVSSVGSDRPALPKKSPLIETNGCGIWATAGDVGRTLAPAAALTCDDDVADAGAAAGTSSMISTDGRS